MKTERRMEHIDLTTLLRALRRRWWLVALCLVVVVGTASAFTFSQQKEYSATAGLLFRDPGFDQKLFGTTYLAPNIDPAREAATNLRLVSLDTVAEHTAKHIGTLTADQVAGKVAASGEGQSDVVSVTATDPDPEFARRLANTFATQYIAFRRDADRAKIAGAERLLKERLAVLPETQREGPQGQALRERADRLELLASLQQGNAELVQPAETPGAPSSPKVKRNFALAIVMGVLLGVALALLFDRLDRRVREAEELEEALNLPILGAVARSSAFRATPPSSEPGIGEVRLDRSEGETFRMLRARLRYFNVDRDVRTVLITSASAADGKSIVALHLAAAAAAAGERVLVIEADLRRPTLAAQVGLAASAGLSEYLAHTAELENVRREVRVGTKGPTFDLILSGFSAPNPADLVESRRMRDLLEVLRGGYDLIVIDTPPLLVVSDAIPLMRQVDGVVIVARLGSTKRDSLRTLSSQLNGLHAPMLGVVANGLSARTHGYYGYDYAVPTARHESAV